MIPWQQYKNIINGFLNEASKEKLIWWRRKKTFDRFAEGGSVSYIDNENYEKVELEVLMQYNFFRTWPNNKQTNTGTEDNTNMVAIINVQYLKDQGYWDIENNYFDFDAGYDKFELDGFTLLPYGDSKVAQAGDDALVFYLILTRDKQPTGDDSI